MVGCGRAFPQFPGKTSHKTAVSHKCLQLPWMYSDQFLKTAFTWKKTEAKYFFWSRNQLILSWLHPEQDASMNPTKLHQGGAPGGCLPQERWFYSPRGVTVTSTNGTGGGHACESTTYHWNKVMTLRLWSRLPATTPHCYVCIQHTSFSYNSIHCISYFTSKTLQAVLALRNCSITITFVKKDCFTMNDQRQQMLHYSSIINGTPLIRISLG